RRCDIPIRHARLTTVRSQSADQPVRATTIVRPAAGSVGTTAGTVLVPPCCRLNSERAPLSILLDDALVTAAHVTNGPENPGWDYTSRCPDAAILQAAIRGVGVERKKMFDHEDVERGLTGRWLDATEPFGLLRRQSQSRHLDELPAQL